MKSKALVSKESVLSNTQDFSLALGGPLFQLLRRTHLVGDAMTLLRRRIIVLSMFCWLPLLVLSALEGHLLPGSVAVPFLFDVDAHVRFLVVMPLLICAELVGHRRLLPIVRQFMDRHLVPQNAMARFDAAVTSAVRLRNSVAAELLLIALVYGVGILIVWRHYIILNTGTWFATVSEGEPTLSLAGIWYGYVSQAFLQFLVVRWLYRLFIWARFLRQVSRIDLKLVPTHPDRVGGLGFLSETVNTFAPLAMAFGAWLAGALANRIFHMGATLPQFKAEIAVMVAIVACLFLGPLLVFASQLARVKWKGLREYDALAQRYVSEFDDKWLHGGAPGDEPLVGSGDIQSLADLGNSLEVVRTMHATPITRRAALILMVAVLAPILPLTLTIIPLEELLKRLLGMLL